MKNNLKKQNIHTGKFVASNNDVIINFYFTPTVLTINSLIFDQDKMKQCCKIEFECAKRKNINSNELID